MAPGDHTIQLFQDAARLVLSSSGNLVNSYKENLCSTTDEEAPQHLTSECLNGRTVSKKTESGWSEGYFRLDLYCIENRVSCLPRPCSGTATAEVFT
jgi:hypothetical protein